MGAGKVAESKIASLLNAAAKTTVVAPKATVKVRAWARSHRIEWHKRGFQKGDLNGRFLVVAATSSAKLHEQIFKEARRRGVLCNVVDVPSLCDFYYPAVVQRGALQIAISTSGQSPALAQRLRMELERQFGPEYGRWVRRLGESRNQVQGKNLEGEERKRLLHKEASEAAFEVFRREKKRARQMRRKSH